MPSLADLSGGMSAGCTISPTVRWGGQWIVVSGPRSSAESWRNHFCWSLIFSIVTVLIRSEKYTINVWSCLNSNHPKFRMFSCQIFFAGGSLLIPGHRLQNGTNFCHNEAKFSDDQPTVISDLTW